MAHLNCPILCGQYKRALSGKNGLSGEASRQRRLSGFQLNVRMTVELNTAVNQLIGLS